jgi:hypothetical protein
MAQTNVTELLDFTGGINNVVAPHLLPMNEALDLTNVDITYGSLKSMTELEKGKAAQGSHFVEYRDTLYFYNDWRANALLDNKLYWTNGISQGKILPDGTQLPLGIITPNGKAIVSASGSSGSGVHKGDFKYTYTFYSSTTGIESAPAPLPPYVTADNQDILLSGFDTIPSNADMYRIYRVGGYLARFTLVATIKSTDLPYLDSLDDTEVDGRILQTLRTGVPNPNIRNFIELNGRLYGSVGSKVYYSGLGAPDSWYTDDFFTMPNIVVALGKSSAGILVFGKTYTYLLYGNSPQTFKVQIISDSLGCISAESIAYYNDSCIFLGVDGIYAISGVSIQNITSNKIRNISGLNISSAAVANNVYYLAYKPTIYASNDIVPSNTLYPGGTKGTANNTSSQGILAIDFRHGNGYSYNIYSYDATLSIGVSRGLLHTVQYLPNLPIVCNATIYCTDVFCLGDYTLMPLVPTTTAVFKKLRYNSPQLIDGSYSTLKEYDKVRINFIGSFNVKVIFSNKDVVIDVDIVSSKYVNTNGELYTAKDEVVTLGIPNNNNKSYSIMFIIEGKGIIKSIQYSWKTRELP